MRKLYSLIKINRRQDWEERINWKDEEFQWKCRYDFRIQNKENAGNLSQYGLSQ